MTASSLAALLCLASGALGRPAWPEEKCAERAEMILEAAGRRGVDPLLMVALDVWECDHRDRDAPIYEGEVLVGHDACPMGVRIRGIGRRARLGARDLYELAASRLERWRRWCRAGHPGGKYRSRGPHHHVAHYNQGNPAYEAQVMAIRSALAGAALPAKYGPDVGPRAREIARRLRLAIARRS